MILDALESWSFVLVLPVMLGQIDKESLVAVLKKLNRCSVCRTFVVNAQPWRLELVRRSCCSRRDQGSQTKMKDQRST
jgi:hypothetical protein